MNKINFKKGFTIAELVIAMMILATLAMLMTPILYKDSQEQVIDASLSKTYSQLQHATQTIPLLQTRGTLSMTVANNGTLGTHFITALESANKIVVGQKKTRHFNSLPQNSPFNGQQNVTTVLKNGVFVGTGNGANDTSNPSKYIGIEIITDINGKKGPNTVGTDIFYFILKYYNDGSGFSLQPKTGCAANNNECAAAEILSKE